MNIYLIPDTNRLYSKIICKQLSNDKTITSDFDLFFSPFSSL